MKDILVNLTEKEREAIAIVCDMALKHAGSTAFPAVLVIHQAISRGQIAAAASDLASQQ